MEKVDAVVVGYIRSSIPDRASAPRQGRDTGQEAIVEILPEYLDALQGIDDLGMLVVTCWLHLAQRSLLQVHPKGDTGKALSGVFATRSPARPNPIAVYVVDLVKVEGNSLHVRGIDAVNGTPVLDVKPFIGRLDD